ncbi:hypothetical protein AVM15_17170 [Paraclostridium benzoelyticum]|nr:hypothetical protein AVM15_17170 [Paraclostridium benzoelyticum]
MLELSNSQTKILETIKLKINKYGYPPSVREICDAVGLSSTSTVHSHMNKLEKLGYIKRDPSKPRAIEVLSNDMQNIQGLNQEIIELPVIELLNNKFGIEESIVDSIKLPSNFIIGKDNFIFKLNDNSLIEAGVLKNDYIVIDRCNVAENGNLIMCIINDKELTLARYFKNGNNIELKFQDRSDSIAFLNKNKVKLIGKIKANFRVIK